MHQQFTANFYWTPELRYHTASLSAECRDHVSGLLHTLGATAITVRPSHAADVFTITWARLVQNRIGHERPSDPDDRVRLFTVLKTFHPQFCGYVRLVKAAGEPDSMGYAWYVEPDPSAEGRYRFGVTWGGELRRTVALIGLSADELMLLFEDLAAKLYELAQRARGTT